jgi:hypothetical protein
MSILSQRLDLVSAFERRDDIQLLAAFIRLLWADKKLSNEDCLTIATCELVAMAATDSKMRDAEAAEDEDREARIARLMKTICKTRH